MPQTKYYILWVLTLVILWGDSGHMPEVKKGAREVFGDFQPSLKMNSLNIIFIRKRKTHFIIL